MSPARIVPSPTNGSHYHSWSLLSRVGQRRGVFATRLIYSPEAALYQVRPPNKVWIGLRVLESSHNCVRVKRQKSLVRLVFVCFSSRVLFCIYTSGRCLHQRRPQRQTTEWYFYYDMETLLASIILKVCLRLRRFVVAFAFQAAVLWRPMLWYSLWCLLGVRLGFVAFERRYCRKTSKDIGTEICFLKSVFGFSGIRNVWLRKLHRKRRDDFSPQLTAAADQPASWRLIIGGAARLGAICLANIF